MYSNASSDGKEQATNEAVVADWKFKQDFVFSPDAISAESLTDFPVVIRIQGDHPVFQSDTQPAISFEDANGAVLPYEVEVYDTAQKQFVAWIKFPLVQPGERNIVTLYIDKVSSASPEIASVWKNGFTAVYLMNDGPTQLNSKNSVMADTPDRYTILRGAAKVEPGLFGVAVSLNGKDSTIDLQKSFSQPIGNSFTVSAWVFPTAHNGTIIGQRSNNGTSWQLFTGQAGQLMLRENEAGSWAGHTITTSHTTLTLGQWQHVAVVVDGSSVVRFYKNGVEETVQAGTPGTFQSALSSPATIGGRWTIPPFTTYHWTGSIEDVRVASVARSQAWIQAEYFNQHQGVQSFVAGKIEHSVPPLTGIEQPSVSFGAYFSSLWQKVQDNGHILFTAFVLIDVSLIVFLLLRRSYYLYKRKQKVTPSHIPMYIGADTRTRFIDSLQRPRH